MLGWRRPDPFYRRSAFWLLGFGLVGAGVSIAFGWVDLLGLEAQGVGTGILTRHTTHSVLAYAATAAYLGTFLWRWRAPAEVTVGMRLLSVGGAILIALTDFLGGDIRQLM